LTYQEALDYVASLEPRGWRLGLDRMREFAHRIGLDDSLGTEGLPQYIHVAGTNGKGSTTAYIQSILHESGYRVGSFFSPYVYDPRERIQLGREYIPEKIFAGLTAMLIPVADEFTETEFGGISEFEFKAAMAFLFYKRLKCEWVALEVGLGGRLDATNIVTPRCSVIVSIGLDHTNVLGSTLEEIAHEKAGIIKPGVPVIVGQMPDVARGVIEAEASALGCRVWRFGHDVTVGHSLEDDSVTVTTPTGRHAGLKLGIRGTMQDHNLALAVAGCDAAGATRTLGGLQRGSAEASIPGRLEVRTVKGKTVILDGAHNADAAQVLIESLRGMVPGRLLLVTGMVAGHEPAAFYQWFRDVADTGYAVPIHYHRAQPPEVIATDLRQFVPDTRSFESLEQGLREALSDARATDTILITGSFYLVGEAGRLLPGLT
jgi:dihydrofolate synthase/folylpolyglutamate synthase